MKIKKRRIFVILTGVIIVGAIIYTLINKGEDVEYTTVKAEEGKLIQTVIETGTIKPIQELELKFMTAGTLGEVLVKMGDEVTKDQVLAKLDQTDLIIKQQEAMANVQIAQANLNKLINGASASEIAVSKANTAQAKASYDGAVQDLDKTRQANAEKLTQAQANLDDLINSAPGTETSEEITLSNAKKTYQKALDNKTETLLITLDNKQAVATAGLDAVNRILDDEDIDTYLGARDTSTVINANSTYNAAKALLTIAKSDLTMTKAGSKAIASTYSSTMAAVNKTFESLNYCFSALENSAVSVDLTQAELDTFKSGISTQITYITTAISALQTAKQDLDDATLTYDTKVTDAQTSLASAILTAKQTLATTKVTNAQSLSSAESKVATTQQTWRVYEAQLNQLLATARPEDISLKRASVLQAQAQLDLANSQIEQNTIKAPLAGVVTKIDFEVGEQTTPSQTVITMLTDHTFVLELDISETDISKLKLGNQAIMTIDAYGEDTTFLGEVLFIEPAETEIQGVVYYKVKINFDPGAMEIKPGMTATATITTAEKDNVLMIPMRAVLDKDGKKIVRVISGQKPVEVPVTVGLLGDGGMVEVLSGIKVNDEVVTYVKTNSKSN
ncbi:MAG: efflux RND transporter periplasmic adaptor subunit [bacterium]